MKNIPEQENLSSPNEDLNVRCILTESQDLSLQFKSKTKVKYKRCVKQILKGKFPNFLRILCLEKKINMTLLLCYPVLERLVLLQRLLTSITSRSQRHWNIYSAITLEERSSFKSNIVSTLWFILSPMLHCIRWLMNPNTMQSMERLHSRQKPFVSAAAPTYSSFRGQPGSPLSRQGSTTSFWTCSWWAEWAQMWGLMAWKPDWSCFFWLTSP